MSGCIGGLLVVTQFFFVLFKVAGVGDVKDWSWPTVLIPLWIFISLIVIFAIQGLAEQLWESRSSRSGSNASEGFIEAFWRKRRAKKHAKKHAKWGITK